MATLTRRSVHEPILMAAIQNGFFPRAFVWRGQRHDVRAVESCRTENRRGQVRRHWFRVRAEGAVYELAQDVARDQWRLEEMWCAD